MALSVSSGWSPVWMNGSGGGSWSLSASRFASSISSSTLLSRSCMASIRLASDGLLMVPPYPWWPPLIAAGCVLSVCGAAGPSPLVRGAGQPHDGPMFKGPFGSVSEAVVAEAQATVTGHLLERHAESQDLPPWVLVNTLAHGDWQSLSRLAEGAVPGHDRLRAATVTFLAAETLNAGATPAGLVDVQRAYLVPLEL